MSFGGTQFSQSWGFPEGNKDPEMKSLWVRVSLKSNGWFTYKKRKNTGKKM